MNKGNDHASEENDPSLAKWLSLCRTEDERQRVREQWRERKSKEQAEMDASREPRKKEEEQAFKELVKKHYPFSAEAFEADWPLLRARMVGDFIAKDVSEEWKPGTAGQ